MYWTDLHQIFRIGRFIGGIDKKVIHFAIPQGTLPWQPILQRLNRRNSFVVMVFRNGLQCRNFDFRGLIGHNFSALCRNLLRFGPVSLHPNGLIGSAVYTLLTVEPKPTHTAGHTDTRTTPRATSIELGRIYAWRAGDMTQ